MGSELEPCAQVPLPSPGARQPLLQSSASVPRWGQPFCSFPIPIPQIPSGIIPPSMLDSSFIPSYLVWTLPSVLRRLPPKPSMASHDDRVQLRPLTWPLASPRSGLWPQSPLLPPLPLDNPQSWDAISMWPAHPKSRFGLLGLVGSLHMCSPAVRVGTLSSEG